MKKNKKKVFIGSAIIIILVFLLFAGGYCVKSYYTLLNKTENSVVYQDLPYDLEPEPFCLNVSDSIKGGTISLNRTEALLGENVTVQVTPAKNKRMVSGSMSLLRPQNSKKISNVKNNSFSMPYENVLVFCKFENTVDGIYLDPESLKHGRVHFWRDDFNIVHIGTAPFRGYEVDEVIVTQEEVSGEGNKYTFLKQEDIDATIKVCWKPVEYTVSYSAAGGEILNEEQLLATYTISDNFYQLPEAIRQGYTFVGWTEKNNSKKALRSILPSTSGNLDYTAKWSAIAYNINYENTDDNSLVSSYTTEQNVKLQIPTKKGNSFAGWYEDENFQGEQIYSIPEGSLGDKTFYAKWEPIEYSVEYDLQGGSFLSTQNILSSYFMGNKDEYLPIPIKKGYTFLGWAEEKTPEKNQLRIARNTAENLNFTAKWQLNTYNISFVDTEINENATKTFTVEDFVALPRPQKTEYDFCGWYENSKYSGKPLYAIKKGTVGNKVLYPRFKPTEYPIKMHLYSNGNESVVDSIAYSKESADILLPTPKRQGWNFVGWYDDAARTQKSNAKVLSGSSGEKNFYAKWSCTVSFDSLGGEECDSVAVNSSSPFVNNLPFSQKEYYDFDGWCLDSDCTTRFSSDSVVKGDTTLYAKWKPISYEITYNVNGGEMPPIYMKEYNVETKQSSLPVPRKDGWAFGGWYADSSFKTPVAEALNSVQEESKNLFARKMKDISLEDTSFGMNEFGSNDIMQTGLFAMNDFYEQINLETAKVEINSDMTLYAKWFRFDFCVIPAGKYLSSEQTGKITEIPYDLEVSLSEITRGTFETVMGYDPSDDKASFYKNEEERLSNPVQMVSWFEAIVFCNKLSMMNGYEPVYSINGSTNPDDWGQIPVNNDLVWSAVKWNEKANGYRLPTEEEWIWCAMSGPLSVKDLNANNVNVKGLHKKFAGQDLSDKKSSKQIKEYAWYSSNAKNTTHPVAQTTANEAGLFDMSGNVWEWCWDAYVPSEEELAQAQKDGLDVSSFAGVFFRAIRGGSWYSFPSLVSLNARMSLNIYGRNTITGFRVVRTIEKL